MEDRVMRTYYGSQNPAPGVKVYGVPGKHIHVSPSVRLAMRTPLTHHNGETVGVFKLHMSGGPQTLGIPSTVKTLRMVFGGGKSIARSRPRPRNMVFQGHVPTNHDLDAAEAQRGLAISKKAHWILVSRKWVTVADEAQYEANRGRFLSLHPECRQALRDMERAHCGHASGWVR